MTDLGTDTVTALGGKDTKTGKTNPTEIEGYYLGSRNVQTSNGPSVIHVFMTPKGNQGLWGTKKLNDNLNKSVIGKMVLVKYKGKVKIAGGKTQHTYEFFVDKSNVIEVDTLPEGDVSADDDATYADTDDNSATEDDDQAAALLAAERQAKVQSLLRGNKSK